LRRHEHGGGTQHEQPGRGARPPELPSERPRRQRAPPAGPGGGTIKRTTILTPIVLASGAFALAPEAPAPMAKDFQTGEVTLGVGQNDVDTNSSKYLEYREIPNGVVAPYLRLFGQKDDFRYELLGGNVQQRDAFYRLKVGNEKWRLEGNYVAIPHK